VIEGYYFTIDANEHKGYRSLKRQIQILYKKKENKEDNNRAGYKLIMNSMTGCLRSIGSPTFVG
jgi:hypothetical protein